MYGVNITITEYLLLLGAKDYTFLTPPMSGLVKTMCVSAFITNVLSRSATITSNVPLRGCSVSISPRIKMPQEGSKLQ